MFLKFRFRNSALGVCVREVPLPQLCSRGNVLAKCHFRNSAEGEICSQSSTSAIPLKGKWLLKFLPEDPLPQLGSRDNVFVKFRSKMSSQSSASAIPQWVKTSLKFRFRNSSHRKCDLSTPPPTPLPWYVFRALSHEGCTRYFVYQRSRSSWNRCVKTVKRRICPRKDRHYTFVHNFW